MARPDHGGTLVWLVSYPKSGNTWLRAMLSALQAGDNTTPDLDKLVGWTELNERQFLDDCCGIASADFTAEQLGPYQRAMRLAAAAGPDKAPAFVKVHDRFGATPMGEALFPGPATRAAIYIVRHPADVAVSLAAHYQTDFDRAVAMMADPAFGLNLAPGRGSEFLPVAIGRWSDHVCGWLDQDEMQVQLLRYEEMLADPAAALRQVADLAGLDVTAEAIETAAEACAFTRLREREMALGFVEKPAGMTHFFRSGIAGNGVDALNARQLARLWAEQAPAIERLDYTAGSK